MTTKFNKPHNAAFGENALYGANIPEDFSIPSCGVEDVDRALFNLFNDELPLMFEHKGDVQRVPVIFATGERAFILRRKRPLTDRHGALILPLISIMRTGLEQTVDEGFGVGPGHGEIILRKRIHSDTSELAKEINTLGLIHQDNVTQEDKHIGPSKKGYARNVPVGNGYLNLEPSTKVIETISIPSPRYFKSTYEVTFWTQYLQQMNELLEAMMVSYSWNPARAFRIESDKGYWFVASVDSSLNSELNFDSFTEEERIVKYSFNISVNGYILNPKYHGSQNMLRRVISAPKMEFTPTVGLDISPPVSSTPSGDPADYMLEDFENENSPLPGTGIVANHIARAGVAVGENRTGIPGEFAGAGASSRSGYSEVGGEVSNQAAVEAANSAGTGTTIGTHTKFSDTEVVRIEKFKDPFTGKVESRIVRIKTSSSRFGEKIIKPFSI